MRIQLIARRDPNMTGLRRYAETLRQQLISQEQDVRYDVPPPQVPTALRQAGRWLDRDVETFLQDYPLRSRFAPADVYHLTCETLATLLLLPRARPNIVTVHAFFTYLLRDNPELTMQAHVIQRVFDALAAQGLHRASAIIAVSQYVKSALVAKVGLPEERIHVIPEAVDHDFFYPREVPQSFRRKYGLEQSRRYVLYVGSEQPRKNLPALLRAFARLRGRHGDIQLLKVGQPEFQQERARLLGLIEELGLENSVHFLGHIGADLPLFYCASDLFVFPSLYEGFGFPPLEAMACGTPVICSNTASLPEVVGEAALLFDPTDEDSLVNLMERVLAERQLAEDYRRRGLENAHRFQWTVTAARTLDLYRQVAEEGD